MKRYFLVAGEASGDLHGSRLMEALWTLDKQIELSGVGGPLMRNEGLECFLPMEELQVMGFSDVIKSFPHLLKRFFAVRSQILKIQPDALILIDYPGFNLRLGRSLRKGGYKGKIIQYICPTVWAHGKNRIELLKDYFDLVLSIYPFETACFSHTSLKVEYVGNPLAETIRTHHYQADWKSETGLPPNQEVIALFPGSRHSEIVRHLPLQLQAASALKESFPQLRFALCTQEGFKERIIEQIQPSPLQLNHDLFIVPSQYRYELMQECSAAIAKSGSVTLELALHAVPTVVHYDLTLLNYLLARYILRLQLPHYCIVNILGNRTIYPELMGRKISSEEIEKNILPLLFDHERRRQIKRECELLKNELGKQATHHSAALAIQEILKC